MTGGQSPMGYLAAYCTNLYLSKDSEKVTEAIEHGKLLLDEYSELLLNSTFSENRLES